MTFPGAWAWDIQYIIHLYMCFDMTRHALPGSFTQSVRAAWWYMFFYNRGDLEIQKAEDRLFLASLMA